MIHVSWLAVELQGSNICFRSLNLKNTKILKMYHQAEVYARYFSLGRHACVSKILPIVMSV